MKTALLLTFALPLAFGDQCPFSDTNECQCTFQGPPSNNRFSLVDCISSGLPSFTGEQLYDVSGRLSIRGDVSTIPANHFQAFIGITDLYLEQIVGTEPVYHNWNAQSFEGPLAIWNMTVIGLAGLFPLKPSNWFGSRLQIALSRLSISKSPSLSFVDDDGFSSMMLQTLEVTDSQIQSLSPNAFNDLPILDRLTLENAGLTSFVLGDWSVIKNVTLDQNGKLSRVSLDKLMLAETISLNGNDLAQAAMEESFSIPSSYLVDIFMENCALTSLSPRLFGPYSHPTGTFSLARNDIQTLTSSDFQQCDNLSVLILRDNLISKIDAGVFDPLTKLSKLDLADALRMPTVDLSEFYKVGSGLQSPTKVSILLDNNNFIKTIVSGSTRVSSKRHCGLCPSISWTLGTDPESFRRYCQGSTQPVTPQNQLSFSFSRPPPSSR